jgi:hypothetical protein
MAGVPGTPSGAVILGLALALAALPLAARPTEADRPPEWKAMEARGATIGEVDVQVLPVFDTTRPAEDTWIGRLANRLHVPTREAVVRRALLFQPGSRVLAREVYESERILRALPFVKDAHIRLEPMAGGQVRAQVRVRDSWTLQVDASFQQVGGQASSNFGLTDQNFLGTGKTVGASVAKDHERTNSTFSYRDPQLFGSHLTLEADYGMLTDGYNRRMALRRPFFALQTPWSATLEAQTRRSNLAVYDQGRSVYQAVQWADNLRAAAAWAVKREDDRAWRAGVAFTLEDRRYGAWTGLEPSPALPAPPLADRRRRGPALLLEYVQDGYQSFRDIQGMDTPEDYNLAWGATLELGGCSRRLGSSQPGPYAKATAAKGWTLAPGNLTLFKGRLEGRGGGQTAERFRLDTSIATYLQFSPRSALAGYLGYRQVSRPDPEHLLYLGAAEGLRGYRNHLQVGDRQAVVSLEQRFFTEQRWWGIFRLGYMVFADAGAVHRADGTGWSPVYPDIGVGLRLGDLKSSIAKVLALTVSVPVQPQRGQARWQWGIQNAVQF